jgi:hypothetical protein
MAPDDFPAGGYVADYLGFWAVWVAILAGTFVFLRSSRGRKGRLRLVTGNLLVFLSLLWTVVVAAETWLRYVYDQTDSYALTLTNWSWFRRHVRENAAGFRDDEFPRTKAPGVTRVDCVGDSFTMGWGVPDPRDCFPQRLRAGLEASRPGRYEVRNLGVAGYSTRHEVELVERLAAEGRSDHVILGYCLNDPDDLLPPEKWFLRENVARVPLIPPTTSFLADFLWFRLKLSRDPRVAGYFDWTTQAYEDPAIFARQRAQFRRIADVCRGAGMRLTVVVFPMFALWREGYPFAPCHDLVEAAWKELGVEVIDLRAACRGIPGEELVANRFDGHPNARAHEIAAREILARAFGVR